MTKTKLALALLSFLGCVSKSEFTKPAIWSYLQPGQYYVGFTVLEKRDTTRWMESLGSARPIQISLWYPATEFDSLKSMTYGDYFLLTATERTLVPLTVESADSTKHEFKEFLSKRGVLEDIVDDWFSRSMAASRQVPWAQGQFPLVIIAEGNFQAAFNHAVLGEFLASHGFVVATCPSQSRISGPPTSMDEAFEQVFEQSADLKFVIDRLREQDQIDVNHISVVAHSFGARSAFLLGLSTDLQALVSLDGGIANKLGREWINKIKFDRHLVRVPILHVYQEVDSIVEPDFEMLSSLTSSERLLVKIDTLHHPDFSSLGFVVGCVPGMRTGPPSPNVLQKICSIYNLTLQFLTALDNNSIIDPKNLPALNSAFFHPAVYHRTEKIGKYPFDQSNADYSK